MGKQLLSVFWGGKERDTQFRLTSTDPIQTSEWLINFIGMKEALFLFIRTTVLAPSSNSS